MIERQELHCHNCDRYVQFDIDTELNGRHILNCPNCGHEHYRIVSDGIITDERWGSNNLPSYSVTTATITMTTISTYNVYTSGGSTFTTGTGDTSLYQSWMNTAAA